jgi:hypothetical protein
MEQGGSSFMEQSGSSFCNLWSNMAPLFEIHGAKWLLFLKFMEQSGSSF